MIFQVWSDEACVAHTSIACDACHAIASKAAGGLEEEAILAAHLLAAEDGFVIVKVPLGLGVHASLCAACGRAWKRRSRPRRAPGGQPGARCT